ncbi:MAG: hypothetical protein ABJC07_10005 [Acidobacteriota bacterium]
MSASRIALEQLLEAGALTTTKSGSLLTGTSARLTRASELAPPARSAPPLPGSPANASAPIERLLGGLPKGKLVELVGRRSSGRHSLALAALASATSAGEAAALVDLGDHLDPEAAERAGIDLARLLWVRPTRLKSALACAEMLLSAGFPLVVADLGLSPRGARYLPDAAWMRLARAAQAQGACLLVVTPWRMTGIAAEAVLGTNVARPAWLGSGKSPRLLEGISSRVSLDKFGRETPATSVPLSLRVAEAPLADLRDALSPLRPPSPRAPGERAGVRGGTASQERALSTLLPIRDSA